jgi:hypothetical protein
MKQCLQQAASAPMGQGFISAARLNMDSCPSSSSFLSIWRVDGQLVISRKSIFFAFFSSAIETGFFSSDM